MRVASHLRPYLIDKLQRASGVSLIRTPCTGDLHRQR